MWLLLIFGFVNYPLQIAAEDMTNTCAAHEKWTVFQRRKYGNVSFYRGWDDYVNGFGDCDGDLWLGLEALHQATKGDDMSLEINMMRKGEKDHRWAKYKNFRIGPRSDFYKLHVSGRSGNDRDALADHNNRQFSTKDADHDDWSGNCASYWEGGWWYHGYGSCAYNNLNGNFNKTGWKGFWWDDVDYGYYYLCCSEMKIYKRSNGGDI